MYIYIYRIQINKYIYMYIYKERRKEGKKEGRTNIYGRPPPATTHHPRILYKVEWLIK